MAFQTIYCSQQFFKDVILHRKDGLTNRIVYNIFRKMGTVFVDIPPEELKSLALGNPLFHEIILKNDGGSIRSYVNWSTELDVSKLSTDLIFAESALLPNGDIIRKNFGYYIVNTDNEDDLVFFEENCSQLDTILLQKGGIAEGQSWKDQLQNGTLPVNAMVINDNYLFDIRRYDKRKEQSLFAILRTLIPSDLQSEFHLTILASNGDGKLTKDWLAEKAEEIKRLRLCKNLKVNIVTHTSKDISHSRIILTNYHLITTDRGFSVIEGSRVAEETSGDIKSIFLGLEKERIMANTTKTLHATKLKDYRKIVKESMDCPNQCCFSVGDNFQNRLLFV